MRNTPVCSVPILDRERRVRLGVIALLAAVAAGFCLLVLASHADASHSIPANYLSVADQDGANDVNSEQVDMTRFGRDDSDPNTYRLLWSWDSTDSWTGTGQTGDACALFDSDLDGFVNFAVCARVSNPNADSTQVVQIVGSPYAFTCSDATNDRCSQPTGPLTIPAGAITSGALDLLTGTIQPSPPASLITHTDPFANLLPEDQDWPDDTTIALNIAKSFLPAGAVLVNVCSYPSAGNGGNNNPFDCIVRPGDGLLVITKVAPPGTTQSFDFTANPGAETATIVGSGSTSPIGMLSGTGVASVSETIPADWALTSAACALEDGTATGSFTSPTVSSVTIQPGKLTTCTFTNTPHVPDVAVVKDNDANEDGTFTDTELVPAGATYPNTVTYKATITNSATVAATITSIIDDKVSAPLATATSGLTDCADLIGTTIAAGATLTCYFDTTFNSASVAQVVNTLTVNVSNNAGSDSANDTSTVNFPGDVSLAKTADAATVSAGDQIGFTITVTNDGPGAANGVTVTDTLPSTTGLSWSIDAANSNAGCSISSGVLTCNWGTLAAGASKSVHVVSSTTAQSCATINNTADVSSTDSGSDQASDSVTVNCGSIALTKVADRDTVSAGDQIGFVITATNSGSGEARDVTITDTLPNAAGLSWSIDAGSSSSGCSITSGVLTCNWGTLAAGASKTVHIVSSTTAQSCATINNTANVSTSNDGSAQASDSVTVNCGSIALTKVADRDTVSAGDQIGFVITATNSGSGEARNVTVTDTLPNAAGLSWSIDAGNSSAGCSISGGVLTCNWGTLAAGASKSVHVVSSTTAQSCATINNTANVSTSNDGSAQASDSVTVNCGSIAIVKDADRATVSAGDQIGFTITVTNSGTGEARGVTVTDTLPSRSGLSWSIDAANSSSGCSISGGVLTCNWGTLAAGASKKVHIVSPTTAQSCATINNTANVSTSNDGSAQDGASTTVNCGDIAIVKTADRATVSAGDQIGFTITVTNGGPGEARGVTLTDTLPTQPGLSWSIDAAGSDTGCSIMGGGLICNWGTLTAGQSKKVHIVSPTTAQSCATINNTANVSTTNDGSAQDGASTTVNCGAIGLVKTADKAAVSAGDQIGFTITATNGGSGEARDVTVTDTLPTQAGLSWSIDAANSSAGCSISGGVLTCNWGTLAAGASKKVHIVSATTAQSCATIDNTANVSTSNDGAAQDDASVTVNCGNIALTKTADADSVNAGDQIGFTLTVTNNGSGEARGVTLTDTLPTNAGLSWTVDAANSATGCSISGGVLTCNWGTLTAGQSKSVHIISPTVVATCGVVQNTGSVTTTNDGGAQAGDSVEVDCPGIQVVKDGPATAYHGDSVTFTFLVTNTGTVPLSGVAVTDDKCAPVVGPTEKRGGDADALLETGEEWVFTCTKTLAAHGAAEANPIVNTATATGTDRQGETVSDTDTHSTRLLHPAIQIDKSGPAGATAGDRVEFTLTVTNPGDTAIPANTVSVTDSRCDGPAEEVARLRNGEGDATPNTLDPGDSWVYRCFVQTTSGDASVTNVATVTGRDVNGRPVSDDDDHTVALQQVAPVVVESGASRLSGPARCTSRRFTVRVTGKRIQSVVWRIDRKVVARFSSADGEATRAKLRVDPQRYGRGLHRLTARVTYAAASQTPSKTIRMTFRRCARRAIAPRFTG